MASSVSTILLFLLFGMIYLITCILFIPPPTAAEESLPMDKSRVFAISEALLAAGYRGMSLTVEEQTGVLLQYNNATEITIFSPPDHAFFASNYPPLALLRSHTLPLRLDREALVSLSSLEGGAKLETLLPGHVLTPRRTASEGEIVSINRVDIVHWDVYDDGGVIIHGISDVLKDDEEAGDKERDKMQALVCLIVFMGVSVLFVYYNCCRSRNDDDDDDDDDDDGYTRLEAEQDDEQGQQQQQQ